MMQGFIENCFNGPTMPATVLVLICCAYWLFVILGALDVELFDFDLDFDVDTEMHSLSSIGLIGLKWLNLGEVPLMMWLSVFSFGAWVLSLIFDQTAPPDDTWYNVQAFARNAGISILFTKFATNPLRGFFSTKGPNPAADLLGKTCEITTSEVTESKGQAQYQTDAAPLLLNVRAAEGTLTKGELATIVDFDSAGHIYYVKKANPEA
jgi:hypothetical protein